MTDLLREAPLGQLIRPRNKVLQYPEERADFVLPAEYSARTETNQLHCLTLRHSLLPPMPLKELPQSDSELSQHSSLDTGEESDSHNSFTEQRLEFEPELALQKVHQANRSAEDSSRNYPG